MGTADTVPVAGGSFGGVLEELRAASSALDQVNLRSSDLDAAACGELLIALGDIQAKLTAAHARVLRRFDAASAHDADGYGCSSAWLTARAGMPRKAARAAVRQMRQLGERPLLDTALAAGDITDSLAFTIAGWTRKLPAAMRTETDRILLQAAAAGACLDDLAAIAGCAIEKWRQQQPDADEPDPGDRMLQLGSTFGGAAVIRGDLTPECAAAVRAVLEALGKKQGREDDRTEGQRFHDGLQLACTLLLRARLVPDRAGADTQAVVHVPLSQLRQLPGAADLEEAWIRARAGTDGYLAGQDAAAAVCDAQSAAVVTGTVDPGVIDKMIGLVRAAAAERPRSQSSQSQSQSRLLSPQAWQALRHAITRLAVDLVSGPSGVAAALRQGLLEKPWNTPSFPLDIGYSHTIPGHIRRAVQLRDRHCAWPKCDRPPVYCDVHHLRHLADGGETSLANCALVCQYHRTAPPRRAAPTATRSCTATARPQLTEQIPPTEPVDLVESRPAAARPQPSTAATGNS